MANKTRKIVLLIALGVMRLSAVAAEHHLTAISRSDDIGSAHTQRGKVKLLLREIRTESVGAVGSRPLSLLVLFEPKSGSFSWRATDADSSPSSRAQQFNDAQAAFVTEGQLVDVRALAGPPRLFIRTYRSHAAIMDDAEAKALTAASEAIDPQGNLEKSQGVRVISLASLGRDFTNSQMNVVSGADPKVTEARWDGEHWIVTLQAIWKATITLDPNFNLVSMQKAE